MHIQSDVSLNSLVCVPPLTEAMKIALCACVCNEKSAKWMKTQAQFHGKMGSRNPFGTRKISWSKKITTKSTRIVHVQASRYTHIHKSMNIVFFYTCAANLLLENVQICKCEDAPAARSM